MLTMPRARGLFHKAIVQSASAVVPARFSDRTRSRLGRRRPYLLIGVPLAATAPGVGVASAHVDRDRSAGAVHDSTGRCLRPYLAMLPGPGAKRHKRSGGVRSRQRPRRARFTALAGVAAGVTGLIPASMGTLGFMVSVVSLLPLIVWLVLVGRRFKTPTRQSMTRI